MKAECGGGDVGGWGGVGVWLRRGGADGGCGGGGGWWGGGGEEC